MTRSCFLQTRMATSALVTALVLFCLCETGMMYAGELTLAEFKKYARPKAPSFSKSQLDALAKGVDKNGDGTISDAEFAGRMAVFRKIAAAGAAPSEETGQPSSRPNKESSKSEPATISALTNSDKATVLLITADELAVAWKPFSEWKTGRSGIRRPF